MITAFAFPLLFWLMFGGPDPAASDPVPAGSVGEPLLVPVVSDSRIWIEGSSNVNSFTCVAGTFEGEASSPSPSTDESSLPEPEHWDVRVEVPVQEMDCGQRRMNRDLYESLKAESHPNIRFDYHRTLHVEPDLEWDRQIRLQVEGDLEVAGVTKTIQIHATGSRMDEGTLKIEGEKSILMSDFSIDPPTGLLGLIRARDQLTVHFQIIAKPATRNGELQTDLF
ncbi:MAG: YceI family protein [Bacteroidota bacterium]